MTRVLFACLLFGLSAPLDAQDALVPRDNGVQMEPAVPAMLAAWRDHLVVALGEIHFSRTEHNFIRRLIHDPAFPSTVNDIVVEFGNSRYQPVLDRFIAGEDVAPDSMRMIWRNTTQLLVWDSPLYEEFLVEVRELNRTLPPRQRLRVLAGDPPINWGAVHTSADFPKSYGYRDPDTFAVIEREVLGRGRKALVIIGNAHLPRGDAANGFAPAPLERAGLGDALAQRYPGQAFLIWTSTGSDSASHLVPQHSADVLVPTAGSSLGRVNSHLLVEGGVVVFRMVNGKRVAVPPLAADSPPLASQIDAFLFLAGSPKTVTALPATYCENHYVAELYRRAVILQSVFGYDFGADIDDVVKAAHRDAKARNAECASKVRGSR